MYQVEIKKMMVFVICIVSNHVCLAQVCPNYAQLLGWNKEDKVVIFHVDDVGMSDESNAGAIEALDFGIASSASMMMPCPWVAGFNEYLKRKGNVDVGLHLTHTSEWQQYRWGPLSGIFEVPGLMDSAGNLRDNVGDVLAHAKTTEIQKEMDAQVRKARMMGIQPSHLDTHMGVLWSSPAFLEAYISIGIREQIPPLLPAGHLYWVKKSLHNSPLAGLKALAPLNSPDTLVMSILRSYGARLWSAGLPVVDDLHLLSYDWLLPSDEVRSDEELQNFKASRFKELLAALKPGITVILIHCTVADKHFGKISDSGDSRRADLLAMKDKNLKAFISENGIITTTWKELTIRRKQLR